MELINAIFQGLKQGYNKNLQFKNKQIAFESKMTEYILTMSIADQLLAYNNFGKLTYIEIEYPLYQFYNNAFAASIYTNADQLFANSEDLKREFNEDSSRKRIDIAVMFYDNSDIKRNYRSLHGVEVKSINTHYSGIENDLVRLSEAMITTKDVTGTNAIHSCFSAFIKSYSEEKNQKPTYAVDITNKQNRIIQTVEAKIDALCKRNPKYDALEYIIHSKDIDSVSYEEYSDQKSNMPDAGMFWDPNSETGHVFGVIIEIKLKQTIL